MPSAVADASNSAATKEQRPVKYIAYYRVSTGRQDASGLGLGAQRLAVQDFIKACDGQMVGEFAEAISGRNNDRPELGKALQLCRIMHAVLVVARLDRLSRNVLMISRLLEAGIEFVAVDFPHANRFTLHILAAVAEYESRLISERMKAISSGLSARSDSTTRPVRNKAPRFPPGCAAASAKARKTRSDARARDLAPILWKSVSEGKSYNVIADEFNRSGIRPPRSAPWGKTSITRIAVATFEEFGPKLESARSRPIGIRQIKVQRRTDDIGPLLIELRNQGKTYLEICAELNGRGIASPWSRNWGPASIRRYLMRALKAEALRAPSEARS